MSAEETKQMNIASCRICLLSKSNCASCPLLWAKKIIEFEEANENYRKMIEELDN